MIFNSLRGESIPGRFQYAKHILAKPLHNHDIVSVHFNSFLLMRICDKLSRLLFMLTYTYFNVDEC